MVIFVIFILNGLFYKHAFTLNACEGRCKDTQSQITG